MGKITFNDTEYEIGVDVADDSCVDNSCLTSYPVPRGWANELFDELEIDESPLMAWVVRERVNKCPKK